MSLFLHNSTAWMFLTGLQMNFDTTAKCRLNLYQGTIPTTASFSEAAYLADRIAQWNTNFSMLVKSDTGMTTNVATNRPVFSYSGTMPTATATLSGTATWGALVNPTAPTQFILMTATGIGNPGPLVVNTQTNSGNVITLGDTITIVNFAITLLTA